MTTLPLRILLVDDDDLVLLAFAKTLSARGHVVLTATGVSAALEQFQTFPVDVLITDYRLAPPGDPDLQPNGLDLIREMRRLGWSGRTVLATGYPRVREIPGDPDVVLAKPFGTLELVQAVEGTESWRT